MSKISNIASQIKLVREKFPDKSILEAFLILFDIKYWQKRKRMLWNEYFWYDFLQKSKKERLEYVLDYEVMNEIPAICNNKDFVKYLNEKPLFNEKFKNYLGRDFSVFSKDGYSEFCDFLNKHKSVIVKPLNGMGGHGIEKINCDAFNIEEFNRLTKCGPFMAEEIILQHSAMSKLNPDSVNTIRIVTMRNKGNVVAPLASIRIGRLGSCVDNFCSGGMAAKINVDSGIVETAAFDRNLESFEIHPDTKIKIVGFQIPLWEKVVECVLEASELLPECRYIGWDVAIGKDDNIYLIEGNSRPATDVFQLPAKRGLREIYNKYLGLI